MEAKYSDDVLDRRTGMKILFLLLLFSQFINLP